MKIDYTNEYKDIKPKLKSYLRKKYNGPEYLDDVINDAFIKAIINIDSYNPELGLFKTWVFNIAENDLRGKFKMKLKQNKIFVDNDIIPDLHDIIPDVVIESDDENIKLKYEIIKLEIYNLTGISREIMIMREIELKTYADISNELNLSMAIVKNRIRNSRKKIIKKVTEKFKLIDGTN